MKGLMIVITVLPMMLLSCAATRPNIETRDGYFKKGNTIIKFDNFAFVGKKRGSENIPAYSDFDYTCYTYKCEYGKVIFLNDLKMKNRIANAYFLAVALKSTISYPELKSENKGLLKSIEKNGKREFFMKIVF